MLVAGLPRLAGLSAIAATAMRPANFATCTRALGALRQDSKERGSTRSTLARFNLRTRNACKGPCSQGSSPAIDAVEVERSGQEPSLVHVERLPDRLRDVELVVGIDDQGVLELLGR